ncbi:MAG: hypothetical protein ACRDNB_01435 [Gaiellaceae bacterium]
MIDDQFSAAAFSNAGLNSEDARQLADALEVAVQRELDEALQEAMSQIVAKLNSMGHNLTPELPFESGEMSFFDHDPASDQWHKETKLRLALDTTVSAGYHHFTDPAEPDV